MKAKFKLILGRRKNYPLNIELEVYKGVDCRVFISTGVVLDSVSQWNAEKQIVVRNNNAHSYNHYLNNLKLKIERAELDAEERHIAFTKDSIRMAAKNGKVVEETLVLDKMREYLEAQPLLKPRTIERHVTDFNSLQRFVDFKKGQKKSPLYFNELNLEFIKEYDAFLHTTMSPSSIPDVHFIIRKYLALAMKDGFLKYNPYEDFEIPKNRPVKKPNLTEEDILALENIPVEKLKALGRGYDVLRDRFVFSCYTGLRISDSLALRKDDVVRSSQGLTVQMKTKKTGETVVLPLYLIFNGKPQKIAEEYLESGKETPLLFPYMAYNHLIVKLKKVLALANLSQEFTFHSARHTCATLLAEKVNDPFVVKDVLGHDSITTSMGYINNSHKTAEKKLAMVKWDDLNDCENGNRISNLLNATIAVCTDKKLSESQIHVVLGNLYESLDKHEMIKAWVENYATPQMSCTDIDTKIQSLVKSI